MKTPNRHRQDQNDGDCVKKGPWSGEEDEKLRAYIKRYGIWIWDHMPKAAGLARTGKSCRLRWMNYLRPNIRHGKFTSEEEETIIKWQRRLGNRWSTIATKVPGRTDNEIKNYWNTRLKKRILDNDNAVDATTSQRMDSSNDEQKPNLESDTCRITRTIPIDLESLPKEVITEAPTSSAGSFFSSSSSHSDITFQHDKEHASSLKADDNKALRLIQFL